MNTQTLSQLIQYIRLISNPWLRIVPSIFTITIITSSHYYQAATKIFDLQASPITISCYSCGKMEAENIGRLLLEPEMTIMINREDTPWITAILEQWRTVAYKSIAVCCSYLCTGYVE